ncbi:MAG TPA: CPBP family intramembrane glutamic endopeptidase [Aeromicrobium sp.]|nr:CPBP family intramembrane glutamic endopeptidase [Aeromicrobium sp.]
MNRGRSGSEIWIVLGLSLGQSAVYALVSLIAKLTRGPLRESTATLNGSRSDIEWLDFTLQALGIGFALVPVALALYLLGPGALRRLTGEDRRLRDAMLGMGLALLIGVPGLGLYALGRELGVTAQVIPAPEQAYWWTVPVLLLSAASNAIVEEVIAVGYLMTRLTERGWRWSAIVASASLRGTYHLYQGFGPAAGNFVMGLIFGWLYQRTGRLLPLVIAHTLLDVVAFVGYLWFADDLGLTGS